jgi:hypothetical protein
MKLWNHQLIVKGKVVREFSNTRELRDYARATYPNEIKARQVRYQRVERFAGAADVSLQRRKDRFARRFGYASEGDMINHWKRGQK